MRERRQGFGGKWRAGEERKKTAAMSGTRLTSAAEAALVDGFTARLKPCPYKNAGAKSRRVVETCDSALQRRQKKQKPQIRGKRDSTLPQFQRLKPLGLVLVGAEARTSKKNW